jgi:Fe2+ transport system protein B
MKGILDKIKRALQTVNPTMQSMQSRFKSVNSPTELLNTLTGYDICERLRRQVIKTDQELEELRQKLRDSRRSYFRAITDRSHCQKEINGLLQRKNTWSDHELNRFTELYRNEMRLEQEESAAKSENDHLEKVVDDAHQRLINAMRERYQEEQTWSDKVRRISTFGTFGLMFVNFLLFLALQLWVEPRKRRLLVSQFEAVLEKKLGNTKK